MEMKIPITKSKKKFGVNNFTVRNMNPLSHKVLDTQAAGYRTATDAFSRRPYPTSRHGGSVTGMQVKVPYGTPDMWCARGVNTPRTKGKPRSTLTPKPSSAMVPKPSPVLAPQQSRTINLPATCTAGIRKPHDTQSPKVPRTIVTEGGKEMLSEEQDVETGYNRRDFTEETSEHVQKAFTRDSEGTLSSPAMDQN